MGKENSNASPSEDKSGGLFWLCHLGISIQFDGCSAHPIATLSHDYPCAPHPALATANAHARPAAALLAAARSRHAVERAPRAHDDTVVKKKGKART